MNVVCAGESTMNGIPQQQARLAPDLLRAMHAYWRAANHISTAQDYLRTNALREVPAQMEHLNPGRSCQQGAAADLNAQTENVLSDWSADCKVTGRPELFCCHDAFAQAIAARLKQHVGALEGARPQPLVAMDEVVRASEQHDRAPSGTACCCAQKRGARGWVQDQRHVVAEMAQPHERTLGEGEEAEHRVDMALGQGTC